MMKVEVWSDIMCPFCYIGKHNYETALKQFSESGDIELEWKSFQLDPDMPKDSPYQNIYHYLSDRKGISPSQAKAMTANVSQVGKQAGVELNFEQSIVANSFDAHRLIHLAQTKNLGSQLKEALFHAHFTGGKDVSDPKVLIMLGKEVGLEEAAIEALLNSDQYAYGVAQDIQEARNIGVRGVPFFVFNRKYAISGAQPPAAFLQTLEKSFAEWRVDHPKTLLDVKEGPSCTPDGKCD